jgi:hypothetical protein
MPCLREEWLTMSIESKWEWKGACTREWDYHKMNCINQAIEFKFSIYKNNVLNWGKGAVGEKKVPQTREGWKWQTITQSFHFCFNLFLNSIFRHKRQTSSFRTATWKNSTAWKVKETFSFPTFLTHLFFAPVSFHDSRCAPPSFDLLVSIFN